MGFIQTTKDIVLTGGYMLYEAYVACVMILSAVIVLNPYTDVFSNGTAYKLLSLLIDEAIFGAFLLFVGLFSLFALYSFDLIARKWAMLIQTVVWGLLFVLLVASNAGVWFPMLLALNCLFCGITFARMSKEHGN